MIHLGSYLVSGRFPILVIVACSSTSSITSLAIFILPAPAVAGLFKVGLLADIMKRLPVRNNNVTKN